MGFYKRDCSFVDGIIVSRYFERFNWFNKLILSSDKNKKAFDDLIFTRFVEADCISVNSVYKDAEQLRLTDAPAWIYPVTKNMVEAYFEQSPYFERMTGNKWRKFSKKADFAVSGNEDEYFKSYAVIHQTKDF